MDNIKVSVIVPVYNGEEYIQTSISSIINQEFSENYEIIVVGGGHAGCEASHIAAYKGHKTALVTMNIKNKIGRAHV